MSIREWITDEYEQRVRNGKSSAEAVKEIKSLIEEFGRVDEAWREAGEIVVTHIATDGMRLRRRLLAGVTASTASMASTTSASPVRVESAVEQPQSVFGQRRYDVAELARSIFDALIPVGNRQMRYGDMKREDWEIKSHQYRTLADNSTARYWACDRILKRMVGDLTTEEVYTESEFQQLIPEIGF